MDNNTTGTPAGSGEPGGVREAAKRNAQNLMEKAEEQARSKLNATQKDIGHTLSSVASSLLNSSTQLRDEQNAAGEYVGRAAEQLDRLAHYIQSADPGEVADNIRDFARRRPAVFIGAAFALGVIGARFLKSSRRQVDLDPRHYSPGLTDREVPTLRAVESGSSGTGVVAGADLAGSGMYGDGGMSASAGMPGSVDAAGPHTGLGGPGDRGAPGDLS